MTCPSHESFPLRFLWAHKIDDLALHTVVGLVLQEGNKQKFSEVLSLQKPGSFCMGLPASSMSHRHREWCDDKKFVQFELAKLMVLHRKILFNLAIAAIAEAILIRTTVEPVSYTHLPSPRDSNRSRMPSSA